jgi:hypothetical protein
VVVGSAEKPEGAVQGGMVERVFFLLVKPVTVVDLEIYPPDLGVLIIFQTRKGAEVLSVLDINVQLPL